MQTSQTILLLVMLAAVAFAAYYVLYKEKTDLEMEADKADVEAKAAVAAAEAAAVKSTTGLPNGVMEGDTVKNAAGTIGKVEGGKVRVYPDPDVYSSYGKPPPLQVTDAVFNAIPVGTPYPFKVPADGTVFSCPGYIYTMEAGKKRHFSPSGHIVSKSPATSVAFGSCKHMGSIPSGADVLWDNAFIRRAGDAGSPVWSSNIGNCGTYTTVDEAAVACVNDSSCKGFSLNLSTTKPWCLKKDEGTAAYPGAYDYYQKK